MSILEYVEELVTMLRKLLEDEKVRGDVLAVEYSAKEMYIEFRKGLFRTRWDAVRMYENYRSLLLRHRCSVCKKICVLRSKKNDCRNCMEKRFKRMKKKYGINKPAPKLVQLLCRHEAG